MKREELIKELRRLKVETGSLACLGCGHEHSCGVHGCAIITEAIAQLKLSNDVSHETDDSVFLMANGREDKDEID